jgi:DNA processing protein
MARDPGSVPDALIRLALCAGAGPGFLLDALDAFGAWDAALAASPERWAALPRVGMARARAIRAELDAVDADEERRRMERAGVRAVVVGDEDYPVALHGLPRMPPLLWCRGDPGAAGDPAVAIVGARRATAYGVRQAGRFSQALAACGFPIVSGGARGIDAEAHRAALRAGGRTVAVLGSGLGQPYPEDHAGLFEAIVDSGGLLVSEFPVDMPPLAGNFPRRNRLVAGLARTVLVVEAAASSGALITARHAIDDHGRHPCAIPGPVDATLSRGCNEAIRDGWVHPVLDPADVLSIVVGPGTDAGPARGQVQPMA